MRMVVETGGRWRPVSAKLQSVASTLTCTWSYLLLSMILYLRPGRDRTGGVFGWDGCSAGLRGVGGCTFRVCLKLRKVLQKFRTTSYSTTELGVEPFDVWCSQSSVMVRCSAPLVSFVC